MTSILYFIIIVFFMDLMSLPGILTAQGLQKYPRNKTKMFFVTGQLLTKSRVDSGNKGNSDCMFNFEGACSLNVRVNTSDSVTCNKLDINNMSISLCCNTGRWCTFTGSRINHGINGVTTDCSNISMDIRVLSLTCPGSSINCRDHERSCRETAEPLSLQTDAITFTTAPSSTMRFTSKTPGHSNVEPTESPLSELSSTVNSTIVNLTTTQSTVAFSLYYSSTYPSGASLVASRSSQFTTTAQGLQKYPRNLTAIIFAKGQWVTKSRVDYGNKGNSNCMHNFEGACSLNVRMNISDSATCNKLDINNTNVSLCCNTGNWCTVSGSGINIGINGVTTDCSNISMDIRVLSLTCPGSSINCRDHERSCTETAEPLSLPTDAITFTTAPSSTMRFTSETPSHTNVEPTESPLSKLPSTVNSTIVNLATTQSTVSSRLYYSSTYPSGASLVASRSSQFTTMSPMMNITISSNSFNITTLPTLIRNLTSFSSNHANSATITEVHATPTTASIATSVPMPSQTTLTSQKVPSGETSTQRLQTQSSPKDFISGANLQTTVSVGTYINLGTTFQTSKTETSVSKASHGSDFNPFTTTDWTTLAMITSTISRNLATKQIENNEPTLDVIPGTKLQTTVPTLVYINPGATSQTNKNDTQISKTSHYTDSNSLTSTDQTTSTVTTSALSSNSTTMQTGNTEYIMGNIQGRNSTNATTTESPDVINTESAMISMYTFLAVFGAVLLAVLILVCVCFYRTKSPKISQNKAANELWPDEDVIQRLHSTDFSPQPPYCINPVYKDYFGERSNTHVPKQNSYGETVCRVHPPTPTLPTHCCSGQSDWSLPPTESKISNSSTPGDIYGFSYKKTDYYVDNISGDESDV